MSFEYLATPGTPAWQGILPGRPQPFFLRAGEGEHSRLFTDHFTVLLSGDETAGQFGMFVATCPSGDIIPTHSHADTHETFYVLEGKVRVFVEIDGAQESRLLLPGDFGYVPAGFKHAYRVEEAGRMMGAASAGFERFFGLMGTPVDSIDAGAPPFIPDGPRMGAAAQAHRTQFFPGHDWSGAEGGSAGAPTP